MKIDEIEVTRAQAVQIERGDLIVIEMPDRLTTDERMGFYELIRVATSHKGGILILDNGARLHIVRPATDGAES